MRELTVLLLTIPGLIVIGMIVYLFTTKGNRLNDMIRKIDEAGESEKKTVKDLELEIKDSGISITTNNTHVAMLIVGAAVLLGLPYLYYQFSGGTGEGDYIALTSKIDTSGLPAMDIYNVESGYMSFGKDEFTIPVVEVKKNLRFTVQSASAVAPITFGISIDRKKNTLAITDPAPLRAEGLVIKNNSVVIERPDFFKLIPISRNEASQSVEITSSAVDIDLPAVGGAQ